MNFARPNALWLLPVVLPLLSLFLLICWRQRQQLIRQFVQSRLLAQLTVGVSRARQKWRLVLVVLAVGCLLLALARPQMGFEWEEARQQGLDIMVAIDVSKSMLASDMQPNRLARAKLEALDLLKLARNDRFGLVAFAGTAFVQCPLTLDEDAFRQSVEALDADIIPQGGTAVAEAIRAGTASYKKDASRHRVLVLFSDGEDHDEGAADAARAAAREGVKIYSIGMGTPDGELIRVPDFKGRSTFLKDEQGNVVKSHLNEKLLQEVATVGNGFYLQLGGAKTMEVLWDKGLSQLPRETSASKFVRKYHERYPWPLAIGIVLLLIEVFLPDRKPALVTNNASAVATAKGAAVTPSRAVAAALAFLGLGLSAEPAFGSTASALDEYHKGHYESARQEYRRLLRKSPEDARLRYNAGASSYQCGQFEDATRDFQAVLATPKLPLELQQKSFFNLGNSQYRAGEAIPDVKARQAMWEDSIKNYEASIKLDDKDADARFNKDFVQKKLEELKKQQEQNNGQSKDQNKDQDKDNDKKEQDRNKEQQNQNQDQKDQQKQDQQQQQQQDQSRQNQQDQQQKNGQDQDKDGKKNDQEQDQDQAGKQDKDKDKDKDKKQQQQAKNADQDKKDGQDKDGSQGNEAGQPGQAIQMSLEQVMQLLDSVRADEKSFPFQLKEAPRKQKERNFKDW